MKPSVAPAETPPADAAAQTGQRWLALSLQDAVRLALQQNLDIKRERLSPQIASTIVDQERSIFDPLISLAANLSQLQALPENQLVTTDPDTGEPVTSTIAGVVSKDAEVTPTLHQTIPIGGFYELSFINTASDLDPASSGAVTRIANPRHESHLTLSFTQPLLRDFGIQVNTTFIRQAQKTTAIAEQQALQAVLDIIFVVQ
jgi:outer membrane protein TolC